MQVRVYDAAWRYWVVFTALILIVGGFAGWWADSPFFLFPSDDWNTFLQSYWWFALMCGIALMHTLGNALLILNPNQPWAPKLLWFIFALWLSLPVLIVYWLHVVKREKTHIKPGQPSKP